MNTYNEKEIIALLQDPARQKEAFESYCQRIQRTAILADTPDGTFS